MEKSFSKVSHHKALKTENTSKVTNKSQKKAKKEILEKNFVDENKNKETSVTNNNKSLLSDNDTIINTFDFSALEELDPLLQEGHKVIFKKEIPTDIKRNNTIIKETIKYRILLIGDEQVPSNIRIELSSENDVFFFFVSELDIFSYKKLQESQSFACNFGEFIPTIKKLLNVAHDKNAKPEDDYSSYFATGSNKTLPNSQNITSTGIGSPQDNFTISTNVNYTLITGTFGQQTKIYKSVLEDAEAGTKSKEDNYKLVLNVISDEEAKLDFVKILGHKEISVLSIEFLPLSDDFMRKLISYRFNFLKSKIIVYQERVNFVNELVKDQNPFLYDKITKHPARLTNEFLESKKPQKIFLDNNYIDKSLYNNSIN